MYSLSRVSGNTIFIKKLGKSLTGLSKRHKNKERYQMSFELNYCPNVEYVLGRLRQLYDREAQDQIFAFMDVPTLTMERFAKEHKPGYCDYPDPFERIAFWDSYLHERMKVYDDSVPSAYLTEMDQGLYGGLIGGEVRFLCDPDSGWISSMVPPILKNLSEFEQLKFDPDNKWFHHYTRQLDIFVKESTQKFCISHFILIDSLNFVFELFGGTDTSLFLVEQPELIHRAIDLAFDLNVKVQDTFFDIVPRINGGTCSKRAQWIPGRIVDESVDPFHMTSVDYFENWGREPVERIFEKYDGGVVHLHGNGHHLLNSVSTIKGLKVIHLHDEKDDLPIINILKDVKDIIKDIPLIVEVNFNDFREALENHRLSGGVLYQVKDVTDIDTANYYMDKVRAYRI